MNAPVMIPAGQGAAPTGAGDARPGPFILARYGPVVDALRPCCDDTERRLRSGILYLRDRAAAGANNARWEAATVLQAIVSIASVHAVASMEADQLETLHRSLNRMMLSAMALEARGPGSLPDAA